MEKKNHSIIQYAIAGALVLLCVLAFIIFRPDRLIEPKADPTEAPQTQEPTEAPAPSGVAYSRFIEALRSAELGCSIGEAEVAEDGRLMFPLTMDDPHDSGTLFIRTDAYGRVAEAELKLGYLCPENPDYSVPDSVREVIEAEIRRRETFDETLIETYLETVYAQFGDEYNIGSIDRSKLSPALIAAYESRKIYEKKAGKARFYCETEGGGTTFEYRLIVQFTLSK